MSRRINRINFSTMIIFGVVMTGFGIKIYMETEYFSKTSYSTTGTVVDIEINSKGLRKPTVSFNDFNGENRIFESRSSTTEPKYHVHDKVSVIYSLEMDETFLMTDTRVIAFIDEERSLFIQKWAVLLFGILFIVVGMFGARIFWNSESMSASISISWDLWSKKNKT